MSATSTPLTPEEVFAEEFVRSAAAEDPRSPRSKWGILSLFNKERKLRDAQSALRNSIDALNAELNKRPDETTIKRLRAVRDARVRDVMRNTDPVKWTSEDILIQELQAKRMITVQQDVTPLSEEAMRDLVALAGEIGSRKARLLSDGEERQLPDVRLEHQRILDKIRNAAACAIADAQRKLEQSQEPEEKEARNIRDCVLWENLPRLQLSGLCFSGGGIRSASFSLGVTQALAAYTYEPATDKVDGILTDFDYLSTVSGGGYTGSFLTRWSIPCQNGSASCFEETVREIARPRYAGQFPDPEPPPVRNLRSYTSYLAPKFGFFSGDTWTLVSTYFRNLILNWSILLPLLGLLALLPVLSSKGHSGVFGSTVALVMISATVLLVCISLVCAFEALPGTGAKFKDKNKTKRSLRVVHLTAICLAAICFAIWGHRFLLEPGMGSSGWRATLAATAAAIVLLFAILRYHSTELERWSAVLRKDHLWKYASGYLFAALASAGIIAAVVFILNFIVHRSDQLVAARPFWWSSEPLLEILPTTTVRITLGTLPDRLFTTVAVPLVILAFVLVGWVLNGFISGLESEDDREWWARSGAYLIMFASAWLIIHGLVLYANSILQQIAALVGGIVGPILGGLGFSRFTGSGMAKSGQQSDSKIQSLLAKYALPLGAFLALLSIFVLVARANDEIIQWLRHQHIDGVLAYLGYGGLCALMLALGNFYFNVNIFSMHGLYRNRLIRAFLGSAREKRDPDPFTKFDAEDNVRMADAPATPRVPLHIVNATLNLVGGKNLAWQERKAEPFTFSALHSGSSRIGYQRTLTYAGERGPTLGTTMAISGAAASPNMGYHSSALMTMLMTFFNVRLGWWLPNPGSEGSSVRSKSGPVNSLPALIKEGIGNTNDDHLWVYLSDGGHFENLGLYEMVWRRCHKIVVIDGSADPNYNMEDLGNAFRKIYIDMGIPIELEKETAAKIESGTGDNNRHCAIFTIKYECVHKNVPNGTLVYIKSSLCSKLPNDVKQYATQHADFPHEPTSNQFFKESQFESYRRLGSHVIQHIMDSKNAQSTRPQRKTLNEFIEAAKDYADVAPQTQIVHEMTEFLESGKAKFTIRTKG